MKNKGMSIGLVILAGLGFMTFLLLLNVPRAIEAEAHRQAAAAMQTQATVTGLAVGGLLLGLLVVSLGASALVLLLFWAVLTGRLAPGRPAHRSGRQFQLAPQPPQTFSPQLLQPGQQDAEQTTVWIESGLKEAQQATWNGNDFFSQF